MTSVLKLFFFFSGFTQSDLPCSQTSQCIRRLLGEGKCFLINFVIKGFLVLMNMYLPFLKYPKLQGSDEGVGSVYHSALLRFPLDYSSFVQFSAALAESTPTSAERASLSWGKVA